MFKINKVEPRWVPFQYKDDKETFDVEFLIQPISSKQYQIWRRELMNIGGKVDEALPDVEKEEANNKVFLERWYHIQDRAFDVCLKDWKGISDTDDKPVPFSYDLAHKCLPSKMKEDIAENALKEVAQAELMFQRGSKTDKVA